MKFNGLSQNEVEESRKKNGSNTLTQIPPDPLWKKILEGFKDPMIMILLVALVVQVVLFFLHQAEWFEPVGILVAIMIANGVASFSENKQEGKASGLGGLMSGDLRQPSCWKHAQSRLGCDSDRFRMQ